MRRKFAALPSTSRRGRDSAVDAATTRRPNRDVHSGADARVDAGAGLMATLFCTQCGRENPDDARFCANCGAALARPGQPVGSEGDRGVETTSTISVSGLEALDSEPDIDTSHEQVVEALPAGTAL